MIYVNAVEEPFEVDGLVTLDGIHLYRRAYVGDAMFLDNGNSYELGFVHKLFNACGDGGYLFDGTSPLGRFFIVPPTDTLEELLNTLEKQEDKAVLAYAMYGVNRR